MWAAWRGHADILQFFINKLRPLDLRTILYTPNPKGSTVLMMALYKDHIAAAKKLIPHYDRDGLNLKGPEGNTALMIAARLKNNAKIVDILLAAQADVTLKNDLGLTAVNYANQNPDIQTKTAFKLLKAFEDQSHLKRAALRASFNIPAASPSSRSQKTDYLTSFNSWTSKATQEAKLPPEVIALFLSPETPEPIKLEKPSKRKQ